MKKIQVLKRPLAVAAMVLAFSLVSVSSAGAYESRGGGSSATECTAPQQLQAHDSELCRPPLDSIGEYNAVTQQPESPTSTPISTEWVIAGALMGLAIAAAATIETRRRHAVS